MTTSARATKAPTALSCLALSLLVCAAGCGRKGSVAAVVATGWSGDASLDGTIVTLLGDASVEVDASSALRHSPKGDLSAARSACAFKRGDPPARTLGPGATLGHRLPIDHIIVLVQENRSFDSYFSHLAEYEAKLGIDNVIEGDPSPMNPTLPLYLSGPDAGLRALAPHYGQHAPRLCTLDTPHDWAVNHANWDLGRNDGFFHSNDGRTTDGADTTGIARRFFDGERALDWYDERDIPFYYELYSTFGMADHYHGDALGPTYPNRMYLYAGTSFGQTDNYNPDLTAYPYPGNAALIFDELEERHVTWRIYAESPPASAQVLGVTFSQRYGWNPERGYQDFLNDAANGTLPAVSFLDADFADVGTGVDDEHPPADIQLGQHFVWSIVKAVTESPLWSRTVLFVTYDEAGGFYDHVPPPAACPPDALEPQPTDGGPKERFDRYGFRVPFVAISPYVKRSFVSHAVYSHASILRFIEARLDAPALTARDANADPFTDLFDWDNPPFLTPPAFAEPATLQAAVARCKAELTPSK